MSLRGGTRPNGKPGTLALLVDRGGTEIALNATKAVATAKAKASMEKEPTPQVQVQHL